MKRIVRTGVFETNSSSSHSLSLAREDQEFVLDTIYPNQDGVIRVNGREFGWGWDRFNDPMIKLAYMCQDNQHDDYWMDLIKEVVMKQTGATEVIFEEGDGYIDHDGVGTTGDIRGDRDEVRNFIFNKNSWLFIGNDNSGPGPTFFHVPEFKDGKMILPEYKYELIIEGLKKTTKYLSSPDDEELNDGIDFLIKYETLLDEKGYFVEEESIYWQVSRPRNHFYKKEYSLTQDYSKNEILFMKEGDPRWGEICKKVDEEMPKERYDEKYMVKTERAIATPGLTKTVKFELKEL